MSFTHVPPVAWRRLVLPGGVPARLYRPATSDRWLVWAHGGSWHAGSVADWHGAVSDLARAANATVVSVDYRLAPAHRHPVPPSPTCSVPRKPMPSASRVESTVRTTSPPT
ncbi:alpha/beta hydrolase fold domain-containing protein [Actinoallomurus sp. NPDC052308]|uniref:alpha/beta hydrolase n=1 Tax=Actinoallomurus sp. NPDC052308 TaxID=3155530 RepID=UPI003431EE67